MPRPTPDLTGQKFGRLTVLRRVPRKPGDPSHARWLCACECEAETEVSSEALRRGHTRSCGCLRREMKLVHGHAGPRHSPTYSSWVNMMSRCHRPSNPRYPEWGGRGITVCGEWQKFTGFLAAMGERPPGTTLGRIDNTLGYLPGNCRWETPAQQSRNKRGLKLTPASEREIRKLHRQGLTMTAIGRQLGMDRHTVAKALHGVS